MKPVKPRTKDQGEIRSLIARREIEDASILQDIIDLHTDPAAQRDLLLRLVAASSRRMDLAAGMCALLGVPEVSVKKAMNLGIEQAGATMLLAREKPSE